MTPAAQPADPRTLLADLERGLAEARDTESLLATTRDLRAALEAALRDRALTEGSLAMERKKRLKGRLDHLDGHVLNANYDAARKHLEGLDEQLDAFLRDLEGLRHETSRRPTRPAPALLRNALTVAHKEYVVLLQGSQGILLFGLLLLTFGIGLDAALNPLAGATGSVRLAWGTAHALAVFSVPLAGILVGYGLLNEERQQGTMHFLASKPVTRTGIVVGKWLGAAGALATLVAASSAIVGLAAWTASGEVGRADAAFGYPVSVFLLALAFMSLGLAASALLDRGAAALGAGLGLYAVFMIAWPNIFLLNQLRDAGAAPGAGKILAYLASPAVAWMNWAEELLFARSDVSGLPLGQPWHAILVQQVERGELAALPFYATSGWYAFILLLWTALGLVAAIAAFRARDAA